MNYTEFNFHLEELASRLVNSFRDLGELADTSVRELPLPYEAMRLTVYDFSFVDVCYLYNHFILILP